MLRRPSTGRPEKISMEQPHRLSIPGIDSPGAAHVETAADRTNPDINTPNLPEQFPHSHAGEPGLEPLVSLKREDQL